MGRVDRRSKLALDESYRYYRSLEAGEQPTIYNLARSLRTLSTALAFADQGEFKLTRQLWRRLHQVLFDRLATTFPGEVSIFDQDGTPVLFGKLTPADGFLRYRPDGCRRADDLAQIEIKHLYPKTLIIIQRHWAGGNNRISPDDFTQLADCDNGVCLMKPVVMGIEVLNEESRSGKTEAYHKWWDLYLQAYCTPRKNERALIYRYMMQIESVWGDLYY